MVSFLKQEGKSGSCSHKDLAKLQATKSFEIGIATSGSLKMDSDKWAIIFGHEVFVHSGDGGKAVKSVIKALNKGVSLDDLGKLIDKLNKQSNNANEEHKRLRNGKDKDFNKYEKELNKKK